MMVSANTIALLWILTGTLLLAGVCLGDTGAADKSVTVSIDLRDKKQAIHSFGASDCWTCQFVGKYWPLEKREAIAELLFSKDVGRDGSPKGIGLSMWRFNVGAGSAEQGDASGISSPWHRAECFLNADGSYDWTKQEGQRWFMAAASKHGVEHILAFTNSPPVYYTRNGIARSEGGRAALNIRDGAMPDFARFLVNVAAHFTSVDYISPINEPQWAWDSQKQEGSPATNAEIADLTRLIAAGLREKGSTAKVVVGEAGSLDYLTAHRSGDPRGDQVHAFWDRSSPCYLGVDPNIGHAISGHSYFTTWPLSKQISQRAQLMERTSAIDRKLQFWQTEFCILEKNDEIGQGNGRDLGMDTALYVARVIHNDLTISNASQWSWWLAVSQADFKDGLVYIEADDGKPTHDGRILASKTLWALGNYSRFVRPGMVRVGVGCDGSPQRSSPSDLMVSAYVDAKSQTIAVVLVNCSRDERTVTLTGVSAQADRFRTYTTSATCDLKKGTCAPSAVVVPARAVVTCVGKLRSQRS